MRQTFQISLRIRFICDHNDVLSENGNEVSILCSEYNYNDDKTLNLI